MGTVYANVIQADEHSFATTVLQASEPVLVDFWGLACPSCMLMAPIIEDFAAQYQGHLRVVTVNVDENPDLVGRWRIMAMPTLVIFKEGREVQRLVGAWPRAKLKAAVDMVLAAAV